MSAEKLSGQFWPSPLPNFHGAAEELRELGFAGGAGGKLGDTVLGERAGDEGRNIGFGVADGGEAAGHLQNLHEVNDTVGEDLASVTWRCSGDIGAEGSGTA